LHRHLDLHAGFEAMDTLGKSRPGNAHESFFGNSMVTPGTIVHVPFSKREIDGRETLTNVFWKFNECVPDPRTGGAERRRPDAHWRARLIVGGAGVKSAFALVLLTVGVLMLSGIDKRIETGLVDVSPQWLTDITTRF
jgi:hypothetical protein